jgi:hypothetical protein
MLVISYMDGDGIKHFRIDQVCEGAASFWHLTLSLVCHQGSDVMGSANDYVDTSVMCRAWIRGQTVVALRWSV